MNSSRLSPSYLRLSYSILLIFHWAFLYKKLAGKTNKMFVSGFACLRIYPYLLGWDLGSILDIRCLLHVYMHVYFRQTNGQRKYVRMCEFAVPTTRQTKRFAHSELLAGQTASWSSRKNVHLLAFLLAIASNLSVVRPLVLCISLTTTSKLLNILLSQLGSQQPAQHSDS